MKSNPLSALLCWLFQLCSARSALLCWLPVSFALLAPSQLCTASAQEQKLSAAHCFTEAPETVLPLLDKSTRLDMLDYFHAGIDRPSPNLYEGESIITSESPASITLMLTANTEAQMFVLNPDSPAPVIGLITTLPTPIPDSSIQFFNSRWQPLTSLIPALRLSDWLSPEGRKHRAEVEDAIPFILSNAVYDPESLTLTFTNNMQQYFTAIDTPQALQWLRPQLALKWNGSQFKIADK